MSFPSQHVVEMLRLTQQEMRPQKLKIHQEIYKDCRIVRRQCLPVWKCSEFTSFCNYFRQQIKRCNVWRHYQEGIGLKSVPGCDQSLLATWKPLELSLNVYTLPAAESTNIVYTSYN